MSILKLAGSAPTTPRPSELPHSDTWESRTARSTTRWGRCGAVISVCGELDAANADGLADHVRRCAEYCEWLVLDLSDLEFIATAGFSALQTIVSRTSETVRYATIVPGIAVERLLRICDPHRALPTAPSLPDALASVQVFQQAH